MAEFKRIAIADIIVPERLRAVEEEHALAIAQSIVEHGLINPITVRFTPAAKGGNYVLVAGAHRLRAYQINDDETDIEAMIVEGDKIEGQLIEITENLFRNDLSVMDRAVFVQSYREIWEEKNGKVEAGRPRNTVNLTELIATEAEAGGFAAHVAHRMGLSKSAIERLGRISQNLHPDLRKVVRGTATADNQSELLKLAKMEPRKQRQVAVALGQDKDVKTAIAEVEGLAPRPEPSERDRYMALRYQIDDAWTKADPVTRSEFISDLFVSLGLPDGARQAAVSAVRAAK